MSDPGYYLAVAQNQRAAGAHAIIAMSDALKLAQGEIDCFRSRLAEAERCIDLASRVLAGEGVNDQGEAWDACVRILDAHLARTP